MLCTYEHDKLVFIRPSQLLKVHARWASRSDIPAQKSFLQSKELTAGQQYGVFTLE